MSKKKAFVLRIDPKKLDALQKWADDEFRSVNGQIEWLIDQALKKSGRTRKSNN
ncbi:Arc family DNA-binding protein [Bacteroidota bacterium]